MLDLSYLVMTAADCADWNEQHPHDIVSLNQLLEVRAAEQPDELCVGFSCKSVDGRWGCETLTFRELYEEVCQAAYALQHDHGLECRQAGNVTAMRVALLAPSCKAFLINVFALFRLGYSVLLVAPQNTPEDIAQLCRTTEVHRLFFHTSMQKAAQKAASLVDDLKALEVVLDAPAVDLQEASKCRSQLSAEQESDTECIIFHSSGSSGTPKPIPQKHRVWTKAAACKPHSPSFTTTPLFHGGISDLLRAMMSHSTLYMFPSTLPITSSNLLAAFKAVPVQHTSFLSVPYILEMLAETSEGLKALQELELVSTGGSPLPPSTGDRFCREGIKLVSRYGSSECGFLMTSFRDFESDRDWSYLRPAAGKTWLNFESQGDGGYELIVPPEWPTRSKANRQDGSFATSDVFQKHSTTPDAWMLTGRADDVLLLVNGEKASPAPLEASLRSHPQIADALVFGAGRAQLGAAVVPASDELKTSDFLQAIGDANKLAPAHAQISQELLILLPSGTRFPRASKGSLQRGRAYEAFATEIEQAYDRSSSAGADEVETKQKVSGKSLLDHIRKTVTETMQLQVIADDEDLFSAGMNSIQSVRVRNLLQKSIDVGPEAKLPTNVVFETSTIRRLAEYIESLRGGLQQSSDDRDLQLMRDLASDPNLVDFTTLAQCSATPPVNGSRTPPAFVVTGATGSLGAHIVARLLSTQSLCKVVCLARAENDSEARSRVLQSLRKQGLRLVPANEDRLKCYASTFDQERLGLSREIYEELAPQELVIVHAAWPVHFGAGLASFVSHLRGVHNLIYLAAQYSWSRFYFCSSTAAVLGPGAPQPVPEQISTQPEDAAPMGYARSKHLAETICAAAHEKSGLQGRTGILRLGQLCGDTQAGIWKAEEGWPLLITSVSLTGCLPDLSETLNWLPLDKAAEAVCDIACGTEATGAASRMPVFNLVSTYHQASFKNVLKAVRGAGIDFKTVPATEWLAKLEEARKNDSQHPSLKMLDLWQKAYGGSSSEAKQPSFETSTAENFTRSLSEPITETLITKMVKHWQELGLFAAQ